MEKKMDDAEKKARELVAEIYKSSGYHPSYDAFVNAVAAALREAYADGDGNYDKLCTQIEQQQAEIARLNEAVAYAARLDNAQEDQIAKLTTLLRQAAERQREI